MPEICLNCKQRYEDHSDSQLTECATGILKDMRRDLDIPETLPKDRPTICMICEKSFKDHSKSERHSCATKILKDMKKDLAERHSRLGKIKP